MKIFIAFFIIVLTLQIVKPAYSFGITDIFKPQSTENSEQSKDIDLKSLVCQFIKLLCPDNKETEKSNSNQTTVTPSPSSNNSPVSQPASNNGGGILTNITDAIKKLWGNNPPPSWGGISGGGSIPLPANSNSKEPAKTTAGNNQTTSNVIQSCVGSTTTSCAYSCANNQAACKTRGCYCVKNGPGAGADCPNFIELSKNKQFGAALTECTGQPVATDNDSQPPTAPPPAGSTYISQCGAAGDFGTCQSFCETNTSTCQKRLKECQAGSTGDDCETFTTGYNYCCVENKADCSSRSPKLAQAFCGTTPATPPVNNPSAKSPLQQSCETETTDNCQEIFETCSRPENRNQTLGCIGLENDCAKPENSAFCKSKGY